MGWRDAYQWRTTPFLVKRQFVASNLNQLWVAGMTYMPTLSTFLNLAMELNIYNRKVLGWEFGEEMKAELVSAARHTQ